MKYLSGTFLFLLYHLTAIFFLAEAAAAPGLVIGRMKVTIMPEYDSRQVLVIYEGKFKDKDAFPSEALFILPKEVTKLTDVCSLSPGGQHFCQLYEIKRKEDRSETVVKLPYPDFFVDFQYAPFTPEPGKARNFVFDLQPAYPVELLEVHIQKPYRSKNFLLSPASADLYEKRDFTYFRYKRNDIKNGEILKFGISYLKDDDKPSVDIQFSPMAQPELMGAERGGVLLVVGVVMLALLVSTRFIRSKKREN
ncbi:MAG: hypothetical protein HZA01_06930 [Nitrospinae bacterium]|nr:hypothetical protein [Nitrospinota bacterium]